MKSDKDGDETINKKEAKELAIKISFQLQAYDVGFDTERFLKVVAKDSSVSGVLNIVLRLLPEEEDDEEEEKMERVDERYYDYSSDSDDEEDDDEDYGEFSLLHSIDGYLLRRVDYLHCIWSLQICSTWGLLRILEEVQAEYLCLVQHLV